MISTGPYPGGDRSPIVASIIWQLRDLGFDADAIETAVEGRGPFQRYDEDKSKSLSRDIARLIQKYDLRHPNKKTKVEVCTDIVPWDPTPPPPIDWSVENLIAAGSLTAVWGDFGVLKSFFLWHMAVCRMLALPFANRKISKKCGVLVWLSEGGADYRIRCRGALMAAGLDPNQALPLVTANPSMLPMTDKQSEEQLSAMVDKADQTFQDQWGFGLGFFFIDTLAQAALFADAYKPNEIIAVNQMLKRVAGSRQIDTAYTDHFNKKDKEHAAGTLNKRNDPDQILILKNWRMTLDKSRYGQDKMWNSYRKLNVDDGNGNRTLAIRFGPTQTQSYQIDNAGVFMSALQNALQEFGGKVKEADLLKTFIDLHVIEQEAGNIQSKNPKEQARSAFRRELEAAVKCGMVQVENGFVREVRNE